MEWGWYISIDINKGKKKIIGYQPEMKINFERTGGFAGIRITAMLDTELMPQEDASHLEKMVDVSNFFILPEVLPAPEKGADYFQYRLTVELERQKHTVEVSEASVPDELRPLVNLMMEEARKVRSRHNLKDLNIMT